MTGNLSDGLLIFYRLYCHLNFEIVQVENLDLSVYSLVHSFFLRSTLRIHMSPRWGLGYFVIPRL